MKIFHKLLLLLAAVSIVPLALACALLIWQSASAQREMLDRTEEAWSRSTSLGTEAVSEQAWQGHLRLVRDKAAALESTFESIRRATQYQATIASQLLAEEPHKHSPPAYSSAQLARWVKDKDSEFMLKIKGLEPYAMYHLSPGVPLAAASGAIERLRGLGPLFAHHHRSLPWCKSSYVWHKDGVLVGYPGGAEFPPDYEPTKRYWYLKAVEKRRIVWTKMYADKDGSIVITYADPRFGTDGKPVAVAAIDIRMNDLLSRLFDLQGLPVSDALLIDYKGRVRATAAFGDKAEMNLGALLEEKPPFVDEFQGGRFVPVYTAIAGRAGQRSGLVGISAGPRTSRPVPAASAEEMFAYARVRVMMSDEEGMDWYYVVKTPAAPVLRKADAVSRAFAALRRELSAGIDAGSRRRGLEAAALIAAVLLVAGLLAYEAARGVSKPLLLIREAVGRIAKGDFEQRLPAGGEDEIGEVAAAVNSMAAGLKEGRFLKSTFERYVSPPVVEQILKHPELVQLGGERRPMTVLFSDIAGFTALAESLSPEALVELINEYLSAMTLCVFISEGTVDKYEGDGLVAFWGAPLTQDNHAFRACKSALDSYIALRALQGKWQKAGLPHLDMRVGISTGPMIVGNMGSMVKMEYTVMGDPVNLGSRLEGANKAYGTSILLSEHTFAALNGEFETREVDLLAVKGKTHAVKVHELLGFAGTIPAERLAAYRGFESGLAEYRRREWNAAEKAFSDADRALGGDPVSRVFLERLDALRKNPPPKDWDAAFTLTVK